MGRPHVAALAVEHALADPCAATSPSKPFRSPSAITENVGEDTMRFLEVFTSPEYADISLASWIANVPHELVAAHLNIDVATLRKMTTAKTPVTPA